MQFLYHHNQHHPFLSNHIHPSLNLNDSVVNYLVLFFFEYYIQILSYYVLVLLFLLIFVALIYLIANHYFDSYRYFILLTMHYDLNKSPNSSKFKSLSQQWTNLIKQFKSQSRPKVDLPPIIFQRKSPLQNYKNALKLHESLGRKKTNSQRGLQLFKKKKVSTININEDVINKHSRPNSDNLYVLTEQQKQLLNSRQFHKHSLTNDMKRHSINEGKHNNFQNLMSETQRDKQQQRMSKKQLIRQIKIYHEQHVERENKIRDGKERVSQSNSNKKENMKYTFSMELEEKTTEKYSQFISTENNTSNNANCKRGPIHKNNFDIHPHQNGNQLQFIREKHNQLNESHHQPNDQPLSNRNRRLSLQFSKDYKSLKYRYQKDTNEQYDDSITNMLIKNRKQKVQHIFSIFNPSKKTHSNNDINSNINNSTNINNNTNKNLTQIENGYDEQQYQEYLQYRQYENPHRQSQTQISQRNKTELITTAKNTSSTKSNIYSPVNKKRQKNDKKFISNKKANNKLRLNIKKMEYEPWHDVLTSNNKHHQSCNIDFSIQNYYEMEENHYQQRQLIQSDDQLPNSKTVIIM